ncbi:MAG: CRISPR-associated helicase Cas3' [Verrucomicrobiales bacterium]
MNFYAHTADEGGPWQPLATHLQNVGELAGRFSASCGLDNAAKSAGLLHDLGKYRNEFQEYLCQSRDAGTETHHAIYGAALAFRQATQDHPHLLPAAFAVAGHHAGLPDVTDLRQNVEGTKYRTSERVPKLAELLESELGKMRFDSAPGLQTAIENQDELALEFATRMIFAALVDADRLDTAHWPDAVPPERSLDANRLLPLVETERERKRKGSDDTDANRELNRLRNAVFDDCLAAAKLTPGFFSLTVPTGGGKTLAAMAFALAHAQAHGLRRVIVVIPFLSIIEQNAKEYRRILGDEVVLEHHSAVPPRADADEEEKSVAELATENWDAPIVVTTSVQFLESLFSDSPAKCRKLHRIAKSVVILDEVQTLPVKLLRPTLDGFRRLQRDCGASFVFCSATQPAFRKSLQLPEGFTENELRPIASNVPELFQKLRRVDYHIPKPDQPLDWPDLAARLAEEEQVLCVVNLRRHAATVWEEVRKKFSEMEKSSVFHLSSAMCAQHRLDVLDQVRELLKAGLPCRLVATQLIEAGVDVDFPAVWRAMGPLDSIVQVAGRCNREGRLPNGLLGQMHVFFPTDDGLPRDGLYQTATGFAASMLASLTPEELATNPDLFTRYFAMLHALPQEKAQRIQELRRELMFRKVAREAKVIEDDTRPVTVAYRTGADIIDEIQTRQPAPGEKRFDKRDLRNLQRYMVNVVRRDFDLLLGQKHLRELLPNLDIHVLKSGHYHPDLGLLVNRARPLEDYLQ